MRKNTLVKAAAFAACALLLSGCSTRLGEHTNTYFSQMQNVLTTAKNASQAQKEAEAAAETKTEEVDENALAAPANFVVKDDGSYSFDAVDGASYYYLYVYYDSVSQDAQYQSDKIMDDGSASYSGNLNDLGHFNYYNWNIRVAAYPDYGTSDKTSSPEAKCDYLVKGAVEYGEPSCDYMWTVSSNKLTIKIKDMEYSDTAYPESIVVTLTNVDDASDVVTIENDDITSEKALLETTACKTDATYSIKADFKWDDEIVTNPEFSMEGGEAKTDSTENLITGTFYYSSAIFNCFDFPHVQQNFDPVNGGLAGMWYNDGSETQSFASSGQDEEEEDEDKSCYFEATPKEAEDGAQYSYNIHITSPAGDITATPKLSPGSATTKHIFGTMNIYADGTFDMTTEYQYIKTDAMNAAVYYVPQVTCPGTYTTNEDGTLNLSYDHENAKEGSYDILTEITGQAKAYYEEYPEEDPNYSSGAQGAMMGPDAQAEGDGAPAAEGEGAPAEGGEEAPAAEGENAPAPEGEAPAEAETPEEAETTAAE